MRMNHDRRCRVCLLSRAALECELAAVPEERTKTIVSESGQMLDFLFTTKRSHPVIASFLHRFVYRMINCKDPYASLKSQSNKIVEEWIKQCANQVSTWNFQELVTAAVIGNTFDYGVNEHEVSADFASFFEDEWKTGLKIDDTNDMLPLLDRIVYLTDNCGELLFDRELMRYLKEKNAEITLVLRKAPMLNDATCTDAYLYGLDRYADRIYASSSSAEIGIRFDQVDSELLQHINDATLIISKGMANYESLRVFEGLPPVAYLLTTKCLPIAEELGVAKGSKIALLRH